MPLTAADALAGRPNLQPVPSTMPRAHWGAARACGPPRASLPEPKEYENTRTRHEFTSLAALGTALGPEPLTSWCAIVSGHQDGLFWYSAAPPAAPGAPAPSNVQVNEVAQCSLASLGSTRNSPEGHAGCGTSLPGACARLPAPGLPAGAARGRSSTTAGLGWHAPRCFQTRWQRGAGATHTPCIGRKAA